MEILGQGILPEHKRFFGDILTRTMDEVAPGKLLAQSMRIAKDDSNIAVLALGKAADPMARAAIDILGERITSGLVISKAPSQIADSRFCCMVGSHPIPDEKSLACGQKIESFLSGLPSSTTLVVLLSGGSSSLAILPVEGISVDYYREITQQMLIKGLTIHEINALRSCIDRLKGGGFVKMTAARTIQTYILSDVIGNDLATIGSGPTIIADIDQPAVGKKLTALGGCVDSKFLEAISPVITPTVRSKTMQKKWITHEIIGDNALARHSIANKLIDYGIPVKVIGDPILGEASDVGKKIGQFAKELAVRGEVGAWVWGGETTVTVSGSGSGGRNLETALAAVEQIAGEDEIALLTFATDGEDSTTGMAGALITNLTNKTGLMLGCEPNRYLDANDSLAYFLKLGGLIRTGSTGNNLNDLVVVIIGLSRFNHG